MSDDLDARLADQYRAARQRMAEIAEGLDGAAASAIVPSCPAWSTADLLAHVTGLAADLGAGRRPDGDVQAWVDGQIADRKGRRPAELAAEWAATAPAFEVMIAEKPHRWWGLVYDVMVHEHDLRGAVDQPGERAGESMDVAVALGMRLVQGDLAKHGLPAFRLVADGVEHVVGDGDARADPHGHPVRGAAPARQPAHDRAGAGGRLRG